MFPENLPTKQRLKGEDFVREFPLGTLVIDTSVVRAADLSMPFAWTAEGEIYDDPKSRKVNVVKIQGDEKRTGVWDIDYLQKGKLVDPKNLSA